MIELRGIYKRFGAVTALNGASLKIFPGEIRALLGSNGSGKSTFIKVLAGIYEPDRGEIISEGKPLKIHSSVDSRKYGISTAFQDLSLIPAMSVIDNIFLGNEPRGGFGTVNRKLARETVGRLLARFHIECEPDAYVQTLMPSAQTMLEVAKAVSVKPRLLLLDEVTAALHFDEIRVIFDIMRELKAEGAAIIYVTHRMKEVYEICDSVTIMRSGETVKEGLARDIPLDEIVFYMTGRRPSAQSVSQDVAGEDGGDSPAGVKGDSPVSNKGDSPVSNKSDSPAGVKGDSPVSNKGDSPDGRDVLLRVGDLKVYPKVWGVTMEARRGEIVGIAGLQGQGQPEFIRALLGAEEISGGSVEFDSAKVRFKTPAEAVRAGVGFVSGDRGREAIFPVRTIRENLAVGNIAKGNLAEYMNPKLLDAFARAAVNQYNIVAGALSDPANSLSGGNQQKLVVARWIAMRPKLLLLDDPTRGVDVHSRWEIHRTLRQCAREGMSVIISSSENEELLDVADRIYVFYEGYISDELSGENMTAERLVAAMMGMETGERTS